MEIRLQHAFGSAAGLEIRDSVVFAEEGLLMYPVGRLLAVRDVQTGETHFIIPEENVMGVSAMTLGITGTQRLVAVAELATNKTPPQINIRECVKSSNFKSRCRLSHPELESQAYLSVAFSADLRVVAAAGGSPDFQAVLWDVRKTVIITHCKLPSIATRISLCPTGPLTVSTSGPNHIRLWRIKEKTFHAIPSDLDQGANYTDHVWTDSDTLVAVTSGGEACIVKDGSTIQCITGLFGQTETEDTMGAACLTFFSKGFLVGSDRGIIALWEKADFDLQPTSTDIFNLIRTWNTGRVQSLASLSFSPSEDLVGISFKNNDIGVCSLTQVYQLSTEVPVTIYCYGFHYGPLIGLDIAAHRPLIATCSQLDSSVRIWNYLTNKCELAKKLYVIETDKEENSRQLYSLGFHPNGYILALGFLDKVRVFHVLYDELRLFRDVAVKSASRIKFSNGGHQMALISLKSVHIVSAVSFEVTHILRDHSSPVQDIAYNPTDSRLVSVGLDGKLFEYETLEYGKVKEMQRRSGLFTAVTYVANNVILACGSEVAGYFIQEIHAMDDTRETAISMDIRQLMYVHSAAGNVVICGNGDGRLEAFKEFPTVFYRSEAHRGAITKLASSFDGKYLFTVGEDGVLFKYVIGFARKIRAGDRVERTSLVDEQLADVILLKRSQLDEFRNSQDQAKFEMEAIRQKQDFVNQQLESKLHSELQLKEAKLSQELRAAENRLEMLKKQKDSQEHEYVVNRINVESAHIKRVEEVERLYEAKLHLEDEQIRQLEQDKLELKQFYERQISQNLHKHEQIVQQLASDFQSGLKQAHEEYENSHKSIEYLKMRYEERLNQMDDEHEKEITELTAKFEKLVAEKNVEIGKLDTDNKKFKSEQKAFEEEKIQLRTLESEREREIESLREELKRKTQQLKVSEAARKEISETLEKKEHKLYEYKFQLKDLKKVKNVLKEGKTEVVKQLQPKDREIGELKLQLMNVGQELELLQRTKEHYKMTVEQQKLLISQLRGEIKSVKSMLEKKEKKLRDLLDDIHRKVGGADKAGKELLELFHTYVEEEPLTKEDPESIAEMRRHVAHLELSMAGLRESKSKLGNRMKADARKRTLENSQLIQELNKLRGDKHELELKTKMLEQQVKGFSAQLSRMEDETQKLATSGLHMMSTTSLQPPTTFKPRATSAHPLKRSLGQLHKGSSFDKKAFNLMDKQRIVELENELEVKKDHLFALTMEITHLRSQLTKPAVSEQASFSLLPRDRNESP